MNRRDFIGTSALGLAGVALPGCTTTGVRSAASPGCLPPVLADESRIIHTMAGLRPYRAAGFVVRREALGDKALVHNYGHGGAGITLSWGSARLAVDLGLPGHQGPVAVIGAGVMGLSTARLVQEAGLPVTVYSAALPPNTTSNVAGGQWHPFGHFREDSVTPEWRRQFLAAADYSWRRFQIMVGADYGVEWLPTYTQNGGRPEAALLPTFPPINRVLTPQEHPFPVEHVSRYDTLYVETGRYLRQMMRDIQIAGGSFAVHQFATPADLAALSERLVFNCTGLGARALFGDDTLRPARGQLAILLPQPEVRYAFTGRAGYMFPRADGIILGGTFELDQWSTEPEPATIERIIRSHRQLFSSFRCTPAGTAA
ncbi:FAD-dependent oxidoreductase [Sphingosinicella sp. CPCC 101087]|uniref:FAD-dependent oxidoreductase n=1 Tax=Sphingosinicella sp. CPCC 101087 TaxID=2497754 RepID=UPI00101D113D|nr:FAD-dependent oxidoreductase [Sphingosinicella sp. CPCC 101087]